MEEKKKKRNYNAYLNEWRKTHTRRVTILLNNNTDADIIAKLDEKENRMGYIKDLIREDLKKQ